MFVNCNAVLLYDKLCQSQFRKLVNMERSAVSECHQLHLEDPIQQLIHNLRCYRFLLGLQINRS